MPSSPRHLNNLTLNGTSLSTAMRQHLSVDSRSSSIKSPGRRIKKATTLIQFEKNNKWDILITNIEYYTNFDCLKFFLIIQYRWHYCAYQKIELWYKLYLNFYLIFLLFFKILLSSFKIKFESVYLKNSAYSSILIN